MLQSQLAHEDPYIISAQVPDEQDMSGSIAVGLVMECVGYALSRDRYVLLDVPLSWMWSPDKDGKASLECTPLLVALESDQMSWCSVNIEGMTTRTVATNSPCILECLNRHRQQCFDPAHTHQHVEWHSDFDEELMLALDQQMTVDEMTQGMIEAMSSVSAVHSEGMPVQSDVEQSPQYQNIVERLMHASVPAAPQRTNVQEAGTGEAYHSLQFGGYTQRGVGITQATYKKTVVLSDLLALSRMIPKQWKFRFTSISLNVGQAGWHHDCNDGWSVNVSFGPFRGGQLEVDFGVLTKKYKTKHRFIMFDASWPHRVLKHAGVRRSVTFYTARHVEKLRSCAGELKAMGFPVPQCLCDEFSQHAQVFAAAAQVESEVELSGTGAASSHSGQPSSVPRPTVAPSRRRRRRSPSHPAPRRGVAILEPDSDSRWLQGLSGNLEAWAQVPPNLRAELTKFHNNMGHPSHATMMRMLKRAGAADTIVKLVPLLPCQVCGDSMHRRYPKPVRAAHENYTFGVHVGIDTLVVHDLDNVPYKMLNMVCLRSHFQLVALLGSGMGPPRADEVKQCFMRTWVIWAGWPEVIQMDLGRENQGVFAAMMTSHGVRLEFTPLESPNQQGLVERLGGIWKEVFADVVLACIVRGTRDVEDTSTVVNQVRNDLARRHGYAPSQWVLGHKAVRVPEALLADNEAEKLEVLEAGLDATSSMAMMLQRREQARAAFVKADNDSRIRRSILRNTRTTPGPFGVGQAVYFRREQTAGVVKWHGLCKVIGHEGTGKVWLRYGTSTVLVAPQQLRHALSEEVEAADILHDSTLTSTRGSNATYYDLRESFERVPWNPQHGNEDEDVQNMSAPAEAPDFGLTAPVPPPEPPLLPPPEVNNPENVEPSPAMARLRSVAEPQREPSLRPESDLAANPLYQQQSARNNPARNASQEQAQVQPSEGPSSQSGAVSRHRSRSGRPWHHQQQHSQRQERGLDLRQHYDTTSRVSLGHLPC
eukprot:516602-Amphidinium_carterae.3